MIEAIVPVVIAATTGLALTLRRIDAIELKMAEKYITRTEVSMLMERFEDHLVRIETKIDSLRT